MRFVAVGAAENRAALDLCPLGVDAEFVDAAVRPDLVERYLSANQRAFAPPLSLPGWVLVDLYLMPGAVGMILEGDDIVAAYVAVPTVLPGQVMGVSLFCHRPGMRLGETVKRLTLAMLRATSQVGITQWNNPAIATHCRIGPMRVLGPAPEIHGAKRSFRYRIELNGERPVGREVVIAGDVESVVREWMLEGAVWIVRGGPGGLTLVFVRE